MNSAGQNSFKKENQVRAKTTSTNQDKQCTSAQKENVDAVRSKNSLGAIKKVQSTSSRNNFVCKCNSKHFDSMSGISNSRNRQPLGDLHHNQLVNKRPKDLISADTFTKPANRISKTVLTRAASARETKTSSEFVYSSISSYKSASEAFFTPSNKSNYAIKDSEDDGEFWTSFRLVEESISKSSEENPKIKQNVEAQDNSKLNYSIVHDSIPSARRKTLKKDVSHFSGYLGVVNLDPTANQVDPITLYSIEYMNDIICHIIERQKRNILKPKRLDKEASFLDNRASVINWIIKLHQYLQVDAAVLFMCIRMFDKLLTLLDISASSYQLTAMTTFWISVKYNISTNFTNGRTLLKLCDNKYTLKNLLEMEKDILLILQFDIIIDDPIIFIYYYIYILQLYESNMIGYCANYLLEILTLDFNCNTFPLSLQAASAVYLSLKFFEVQDRVWCQLENYYGYHNKAEMFPVQRIMIKNIMLTNHEDCPYKETLQKYSTSIYGKVSCVVPKILKKWYNVTDIS